MRQRRHVATLALLALLPLGACSEEDDPPVSDPSPSTSDSPTPTAEPAPHQPTEPPVPEAMSKANKAGAKAFVEYYWEVVNYAQATGDVGALHPLGLEGCAPCAGVAAGIREVYDQGGWFKTGGISLRFRSVKTVRADVGKVHIIDFAVRTEPHEMKKRSEAEPVRFQRAENPYIFHVIRFDDGWRISNWERG